MANYVAIQPPVDRDPLCLAPKVRAGQLLAIAECNAQGWDAIMYEGCRSEALQEWYFAHGASKAPHAINSWHIYGLALDVTSRQHGWDLWGRSIPTAWQTNVVAIFKKYGFKWGGDWPHYHDWPHFQWAACKISPSPVAINLLQTVGKEAVWTAVGAQ